MTQKFDLYQQMIYKSKYARFLPEKNRREHFEETVDRYLDYITNHANEKHGYKLPDKVKSELREAIINLDVMPSMRAMMTAGKALERDNTAGYNCAYLVVDDPKAFDEAMHILMCGTGVGFSVERQYINKLPEIPEKMFDNDTIIVVKDSKEGWAKAFRLLIAHLYAGEIPSWDTSKLRAAGAILKTFGGRSSGPEPLEELFRFTVQLFQNAAGRKLTSLECHDLMCKVAETIVVGGVRRSAMISLSNLSDERMRLAKSGQWWDQFVHRALSNNSAVYTEKPDSGIFMKEWLALYESKSGERGIFSREAAKKIAGKNGRRDPNHDFGTNPCSEIILRPFQFCNLTEVVARAHDTHATFRKKVELAAILGTLQSTLTYFPYLRKIWQRNTEDERLLGVSITGIYDNELLNNYLDTGLPKLLEDLKNVAIDTNKRYAENIGIPASAAITCVKPSGTVSQLVDAASGIHQRHSDYYLRRIRSDNKDPLTKHLIEAGIPHEPDATKPGSVTVFTFPKRAPVGATTRDNVTSLDHLKLWLVYQRHWCEHKPSCTVSVKENEWPAVGAWVYDHFDEISGISFLPYDGGIYRQAPYESISKEEFDAANDNMPQEIDWDNLVEEEDNVEGTQMLACGGTGGGCEL